ncbi:MAG: MFS transporter [Xanthobacteraceae bacterium]|nr:MFS transporter [Xanthobacteraceae bacterium]
MQASRPVTITALGIAQILGWGTSFYFPAVLAPPIVADTGWSLAFVVSGTSIGLLVAGLIAPKVGAIIDRHGGRPVLAASSLMYAAGLLCIGLAPNLPTYLLGWIVLGGGMGSGLYDAVFAALGKLYGRDARAPITNLTLFGGFASTVCWPLSAFLAENFGWRSACLIYAALHLLVSLPLQMAVMPPLAKSQPQKPDDMATGLAEPARAVSPANERLILLALASILTISASIGSIVIVHMMIFLQDRGASFALAVSLGTLFGPAQVGARVVERMFGASYHPIWTMIASCVLMLVGLIMLVGGAPLLWLTILIYGGGYGIMWIARGTLPLALFGPERYATLMGRLAFPSLIAQALAPSAGALLIEHYGAHATAAVLTALAALNVALIAVLWALCRPGAART